VTIIISRESDDKKINTKIDNTFLYTSIQIWKSVKQSFKKVRERVNHVSFLQKSLDIAKDIKEIKYMMKGLQKARNGVDSSLEAAIIPPKNHHVMNVEKNLQRKH
jgi:hypothetical protein